MPNFSSVIDILTLVAILAGVYFGIAELRRARRARRDASNITVLTSVIPPSDYSDIQRIVYKLAVDAPAEMITSDPDLYETVQITVNQLDIMGFLVYDRLIDLKTFDYLFGNLVRQGWARLHNYVEAEREASGTQSIGEWFQWLAERLEEHPIPGRAKGAHIAFRDWSPK